MRNQIYSNAADEMHFDLDKRMVLRKQKNRFANEEEVFCGVWHGLPAKHVNAMKINRHQADDRLEREKEILFLFSMFARGLCHL